MQICYILVTIISTVYVSCYTVHAVRQCLGILEEVSNVDSKQQPMTATIELHET